MYKCPKIGIMQKNHDNTQTTVAQQPLWPSVTVPQFTQQLPSPAIPFKFGLSHFNFQQIPKLQHFNNRWLFQHNNGNCYLWGFCVLSFA